MYKVDLTKPVTYRTGEKARVLCTDRKGEYPVLTLDEESNELWPHHSDGSSSFPSRCLINPAVRLYVSLYRNYNFNLCNTQAFATIDGVEAFIATTRIGVLEFELVDGYRKNPRIIPMDEWQQIVRRGYV